MARAEPTETTLGHALTPVAEDGSMYDEPLRMVPMPTDLVEQTEKLPPDHGTGSAAGPGPSGRVRGAPSQPRPVPSRMEVPALSDLLPVAGGGHNDITEVRGIRPRRPPATPTQDTAVKEPTTPQPSPETPSAPDTPSGGSSKERPMATAPLSGNAKLARPEDLGLDEVDHREEPMLMYMAMALGLSLFAGLMLLIGAFVAAML